MYAECLWLGVETVRPPTREIAAHYSVRCALEGPMYKPIHAASVSALFDPNGSRLQIKH